MKCPCGRDLPLAFPGARIVCACGRAVELPFGEPKAMGPYRSAVAPPIEDSARETPCPYCGNGCPPLVRICPHCDVRLDSVRCAGCFSLQAPGSFACSRCGRPLELEPLLDATDAPCPRCKQPLEGANTDEAPDARVHECPRCGGMFVPRHVLADILSRAEIGGPLRGIAAPRVSAVDPITYLPCPLCHSSMNRVNFGRVSGVIVDVCRNHGTWFDAGELTRVVAFAAAGGLDKARAREQTERRALAQRLAEARADLPFGDSRHDADNRVEAWRDFLDTLLWW